MLPPHDLRWLDSRVASAALAARGGHPPPANYQLMANDGRLDRVTNAQGQMDGMHAAGVVISYPDGRRFEGMAHAAFGPGRICPREGCADEEPRSVRWRIHGIGVMWGANGAPLFQGRWEDGQLVEPFATPTGFIVGPMPFDASELHPSVAAAAMQARNASPPSGITSTIEGSSVVAFTSFTCSEDGCLAFARLRYADGRVYDGAVEGDGRRARIVSLHGPGVMWRADGTVAQSGVWHRSLLLQSLQDVNATAVTPPRSPTRDQYAIQRQSQPLSNFTPQ